MSNNVKKRSYIKTALNLIIHNSDIIIKSSVLAGIAALITVGLVFLIP